MGLAIIATVFGPEISKGVGRWLVVLLMLAGGSVLGYFVASRVQMTEMPQLVAALHSFVGLAAVFIGFNAHIEEAHVASLDETARSLLTGFSAILAHKTLMMSARILLEHRDMSTARRPDYTTGRRLQRVSARLRQPRRNT
jgi:NAD(P) transhydrogenase subunit beta